MRNEEEARRTLDVSRETLDRLARFELLLRRENGRQNLVAARSLDEFWSRHVLDSAQLTRLAPPEAKSWLDLGTGAGFPGLLVPLFHSARAILVESRRLRAEFLRRAAEILEVEGRVEILHAPLETVPSRTVDVISARAFAPLAKLLALAERFSTGETVWVLPKGRKAESELDSVRSTWQGDFRLAPSLTDPDARIIVAREVRRREKDR